MKFGIIIKIEVDKMIKHILMDLGNTIINNIDFNLKLGLKILYNQSVNKKIELDNFISIGFELMKEMYKDRNIDNLEVPFIKYLSNLEKITDIKYIKSYDELELEIYQKCVKDKIIDDAFDFLVFAKKYGLKVYIYSNSTFSKKVLMKTIDKFQLNDLIYELYSSSDVGFRKPSYEFFSKTDLFNNINKDESIFIGNDYYYDRLFAKAIGINFGWYNINKKEENGQNVALNFSNYQTLKEFILNYDK